MIGLTSLRTMFCAHRFSYDFTAPDGSEGTTACRVVSFRSTMGHHGFKSKEARFARKQNIDYTSHHPLHCWWPAKVMDLANSTKWLIRSTQIFIVVERSNIYVYIMCRRSITPQHIKYNSKSLDVVQSLYFGSKMTSSGTYK